MTTSMPRRMTRRRRVVRALIAADKRLTRFERWLTDQAARLVIAVLDPPSRWPRDTGTHTLDVLQPQPDEWTDTPDDPDHPDADEDDLLKQVHGHDTTPAQRAAGTPAPPPPPVTRCAVVQAACLYCGDVEVPATAVEVIIFRNALHLSWYGITCPRCSHRTIRSAASDTTREALLKATGARIDIELIPAEYLEQRPAARALTNDDILDAHLWLETTDDLAAAAAVVDLTDRGAA